MDGITIIKIKFVYESGKNLMNGETCQVSGRKTQKSKACHPLSGVFSSRIIKVLMALRAQHDPLGLETQETL